MAKNARKKRKKRKELATCQKKIRYTIPALARRAAKRQDMRAYYCPLCKAFHLTSKLSRY